LAIIACLNSVVSVYYYLKIVRLMVFKESESSEGIGGFGYQNQSIIFALTVPVVLLGIFWEKLMIVADGAKLFIP
jgi:NADH-quinone oxidoreductase subunit N